MKNKGFTLLELLVVIGIIGIMMALATVAYSSVQKNARDSRRKQDLVAIQNALEQYYSENSYAYPANCAGISTYLKSNVPVDPETEVAYSGAGACATDSYCICADLDGAAGGNSSDTSCTWAAPNVSGYYCVANLQ